MNLQKIIFEEKNETFRLRVRTNLGDDIPMVGLTPATGEPVGAAGPPVSGLPSGRGGVVPPGPLMMRAGGEEPSSQTAKNG